MNNNVICHNCSDEYVSIGGHWSKSSTCSHPELTDVQKDVATGLILGDGTTTRNYENSVIQVKMVTPTYLNYLSDLFGPIGLSVKLHKTGNEQAKMNRDSGFSVDANGENYRDVYRWMTRAHPYFNKYDEWYDSGRKVFPDDVTITPSLLKTWYVCDGDIRDDGILRISSAEQDLDKISLWFEGSELPVPRNSGHRIYWSVQDSKKVLEYMGSPPPDFEYKWM
jgi:hypothetical protein